MPSYALPPPLDRHSQSLPAGPLRSALKRVQETERPFAGRRVTFQSSRQPVESELIAGLTMAPAQPVSLNKQDFDKPLPGLPTRRPRVTKRSSGSSTSSSHRDSVSSADGAIVMTAHIEKPKNLPSPLETDWVHLMAMEPPRPALTSSQTAPLPVSNFYQPHLNSPSFDYRATQTQTEDPLAFIPIMQPTKAPLRGWSDVDLSFDVGCPDLQNSRQRGSMDSTGSSTGSSRTTSRVVTPTPKSPGFPFPAVEVYDEEEGEDEGLSKFRPEFGRAWTYQYDGDAKPAQSRASRTSQQQQDYHPSIQEMLSEIDQAHSEWKQHRRPALAVDSGMRRLSKMEVDQLRKSGQSARHRRTMSSSHISEGGNDNAEGSTPTSGEHKNKKEAQPEPFGSFFETASERGHADYPASDLVVIKPDHPTEAAKPTIEIKKVPRKPVMQSFTRPDMQTRSQSAVVHSSTSTRPSQSQALKPNELDLFATNQIRDHKRNYDRGKKMAEEIAKEFWAKHRPNENGAKDRPTTKELLEGLFYHAPADLHPCPERLEFLGIQPSRQGLFRR